MKKKVKYNKSEMRFGDQEDRTKRCALRMHDIEKFRSQGFTWEDIGMRYKLSRQAVHKFYKENQYLLEN
tara:strand:+ start:36 stop:242 length:207 start_codon:yes stop_codon:yes gene_type:complete